MTLNYVTLTCDLYDGSGNIVSAGTATFTPSAQLTDGTDHEIITQAPVTAVFRGTGSPTATLLATDNSAVSPAGWAWTVTFTGVPGSPAGFSFFLPFSGGAAQNLSALSPVSTAVTQFPAWPGSALGDTVYGGASPAGTPARLAGPTAAGVSVLTSTPSGGVAQAPAWLQGWSMGAFLAPRVVALSQSGGLVAVTGTLGNDFRLTLTASGWTISSPTGMADGQQFTVTPVQDATGGRTVSWGSAYDWGTGNSAPALSTAAGARDLLGFKWYADISKAVYLGAAFPQGF